MNKSVMIVDILNQDIDILHTALGLFEFSMSWLVILITLLPSIIFIIIFRSELSKIRLRSNGSKFSENFLALFFVSQLLVTFVVHQRLKFHHQTSDHSEQVINFIQSSQLSQIQRVKLKTYIDQSTLPIVSDRVKPALTQLKQELDIKIREQDNASLLKQVNQI